MTHTTRECTCGNTFEAYGWNNNYNKILRCQECEAKRVALLAEINEALSGKNVDTLYISTEVYRLFTVDDFGVDYSARRPEKMNGALYQIVEM